MARRKPKCRVQFVEGASGHGPTAILWNRLGKALNVMNFPKGHRLTAKDKAHARRTLMRGCRELDLGIGRR